MSVGELWGGVMALAVCVFVFGIFMWFARKVIGDIGVALVIVFIAIASAVQGWLWLLHSDKLALEMLAYAIPGALLWGTIKGVQYGVRSWRGRPTQDAQSRHTSQRDGDPHTCAVGDTVALSNWDLTLIEVVENANNQIVNAWQHNAQPRGQYVLVTYEATYTGSDPIGDPTGDLLWRFDGSDRVVYKQDFQVTQATVEQWPRKVRSGGTARQQVLFDVPSQVIDGGALSIEEWMADRTVTCALPPVSQRDPSVRSS